VPDGECSAEIDAEPNLVWQIVSDIGLSSRFSTEVRSEWLDPASSPDSRQVRDAV
jgi:sigma54-dependent transcription regulator